MKWMQYKGKPGRWLITVSVLVLLAAVAMTQVHRSSQPAGSRPVETITTAQDADSVEMIGTPVNDDPWEAIENIVNAYYDPAGISYAGSVKVIDDNGDHEKIVEEQAFNYSLLGNDYHYRLGPMELVNRKNFLLLVDHGNKLVTLAPAANQAATNKLFDLRAFKNEMEARKAHAGIRQLGEERILTIDRIGDPDIQGYRIYYSPQTWRVHKMLIGMIRLEPLENEAEHAHTLSTELPGSEQEIDTYTYYLEVNFNTIQPLSMKGKEYKPEENILTRREGKAVLTPAYAGYQFINNLEP